MNRRCIMHVDMDAFFAAVEQRSNPALRGRPVIVSGTGRHGVVAAASYEAKRRGVKAGMNRWQAERLCPEVVAVPGRHRKYIHSSAKIVSCCEEFTPLVEVYSIDEAFLDVSDSLRLFGGAMEIGRRLKERIGEETGLSCSVGIASNKMLAKLATGLGKPNGLRRLEDEEVPRLLERTPVGDIWGIGPRLAAFLNRLGIFSAAELGRYPQAILEQKLGVWGQVLSAMGRGEYNSPVKAYVDREEPKSVGHSRTFERDISDPAEIWERLMQLAEAVARRLRRHGLYSRTAALTVRYKDFTGYNQRCTYPDYSAHGPEIGARAWEIFCRRRHPQPIRLLGVSASGLLGSLIPQTLFFEEHRREMIDEAVDRINDRHGDGAVFWGAGQGRALRSAISYFPHQTVQLCYPGSRRQS